MRSSCRGCNEEGGAEGISFCFRLNIALTSGIILLSQIALHTCMALYIFADALAVQRGATEGGGVGDRVLSQVHALNVPL